MSTEVCLIALTALYNYPSWDFYPLRLVLPLKLAVCTDLPQSVRRLQQPKELRAPSLCSDCDISTARKEATLFHLCVPSNTVSSCLSSLSFLTFACIPHPHIHTGYSAGLRRPSAADIHWASIWYHTASIVTEATEATGRVSVALR